MFLHFSFAIFRLINDKNFYIQCTNEIYPSWLPYFKKILLFYQSSK